VRVIYHSFERSFSDSPRAVFEVLRARRPGAQHVWLSRTGDPAGFPEGVQVLEYGSPAAIAAVESCDLLVANTHTDFDWEKRPGTTYLQTWHGTPLKRIHWDVLWAPEGRLERLQRDVDRWDVLLAQNAVSVPLLRRAFRYDGTLLETGYPRNDVLCSQGRDAVRARVRERLGIADDRTVVLYTPTWRDDAVFPEGGRAFELGLDADAFAERFGDDHVLLLRLHRMVEADAVVAAHDSVRDVSAEPEVSELYLAADVMVTDYSSTMFDFAVTGKPMLFLAYDLADYRDRLRGFYLDLEEEAPGRSSRRRGSSSTPWTTSTPSGRRTASGTRGSRSASAPSRTGTPPTGGRGAALTRGRLRRRA
jgi:CDP-glycerol glycerophosphotransferase